MSYVFLSDYDLQEAKVNVLHSFTPEEQSQIRFRYPDIQRLAGLHLPIFHRRDIFNALIDSPDFQINASSQDGKTPLMMASQLTLYPKIATEATEFVGELLNRGASVTQTDVEGHTALYFAIEARNEPLTALLIERGSEFDYQASHSNCVRELLAQDPIARDWIRPILEQIENTQEETQDPAGLERVKKQLLLIKAPHQDTRHKIQHYSPNEGAQPQAIASFTQQSIRVENKFLSPSPHETDSDLTPSDSPLNRSSRRRLGNT